MAEGLVLNEHRQLSRRELIYYLKVTDRRTAQELGRMADIHAGGMLLLSEKPLPGGITYEAALELPKALVPAAGRNHIDLDFECVWSRPGPKNSSYSENGVRFLSLDEDGRAVIDRLIDLFAMPSKS